MCVRSWFELVTSALIRASFALHEGRYRWARKGTAGLVIVEIWPNRTLRKVLPGGRINVHKHCSVEDAVAVIGSAAIDSDFLG